MGQELTQNSAISYKKIWQVATPIILGGVATNIVNVTDTAFLGHHGGEVALAAAGNGSIFYLVLFMAGLGYCVGGEVLIGRRNGEGDKEAIGRIFFHLSSALFLLSLLFFFLSKYSLVHLIESINKSKTIADATSLYLDYRLYGIFFSFAGLAIKAFFVGITQTRILIWNTVIMSIVNIVLDYTLILGHYGFPEMGIKGAAIASVIAEACALLHFIVYLFFFKHQPYLLAKLHKINYKLLASINKNSLLIMSKNLISVISWLVFFLIIEQIGQRELAISHIARSIYMIIIIPLLGFSESTASLVSNVIGQGKLDDVPKVIKKISLLSLACTLCMLPINFIFPESVISLYTPDTTLITDTVLTVQILGGSIAIFSIVYISFLAVIGTGNSKIALAIETFTVFVYISSCYVFAHVFHWPIHLVWCSEYVYFLLLGIISFFYLRSGHWRKTHL